MHSKAPIVVFDFDLTLTAWDTAARFFRWLVLRQVWRVAAVAVALPVLGMLLIARPTRKWPVRFIVWIATLGLTHTDLMVLARHHARHVFGETPPVFLREGLSRLQHHIDNGDSVVIATGCLEILARELLQRAGFGVTPLVGSTLRPFFGGMASHEHCVGQTKVRMLTQRGFVPPWAIGYTDHKSDLPLLQRCAERHLVNAKANCIKAVEESLADKVNLLTWQ
jgi:phosphatidylglycerophosphatase C